ALGGGHRNGAGRAYLPLHGLCALPRSRPASCPGHSGLCYRLRRTSAMTSHRMRRALWAVLLLLALLMLAVYLGFFRSSSVGADVEQPLSVDDMRQLLPRGREMAAAADCFGCHSTPQGPL